MNPKIDSAFLNKKGQKVHLKLFLDDGEDVLESIKQAMAENNLDECKTIEFNGKVKEGMINYFMGNSYRSKELNEVQIQRVSSQYTKTKQGITGDLHVTVAFGNNRITGTLVKGKSSGESQITLEFIKLIE